jgi:hypothetical protein
MQTLARMTISGWEPGIGDPTFVGWFTVFAYAGAAWLCWRRWRVEQVRRPSIPAFWLALTIVLVLLCINKQLDLQTLLTQLGRRIARSGGWYERRHEFQIKFIAGIAIADLLILAAIAWWIRGFWRDYGPAAVGLALLLAFVLIRAGSFHRIETLLGMPIGALRVNHVLELGGIAMVAAGCVWRWDLAPAR